MRLKASVFMMLSPRLASCPLSTTGSPISPRPGTILASSAANSLWSADTGWALNRSAPPTATQSTSANRNRYSDDVRYYWC